MRGARMFGRRNVAVASIVSAIAVASLVFGSVTPADADAPQAAQSESPTQVPGLPVTKPADVHAGSSLGSSSALAAPGNLTPAPTGTVNEPTPTAEDPDENAASNGIAEGSQITSRSTYENVWTNPDGTTTDQMSLTPINTKDSSGKWVDVNSTVAKTASGDYTATDNPVQPTFASSTSDSTDYSVQSATTGAKVSFELEGEHDADAHKPTADQVDASDQADASVSKGVAYDDVLKNTDASYQVSDSGVKESLILAVPPTSANPSYTWDVHAPGLTLTDGPNGSVLFQDSDGKTVFYTPTPLMTDSSGVPGASSDAVDTIPLTLKHMSGADWTMTLTPDATWLNDPARIYPVSLDPSMQNGSPNITAYESSGNNKILATEPYANVGNSQSASPYSIWRSVGTYPYNQTFGKTILSAQLLEQENNNGTAAAEGTQAGWAAAYNYNCNATRVTGSSFTAGMTGTADIDVTALVQYWVSQRSDGGSFCLQASESATQYTYKQINTQLYIQYENTPTVVGAPTTVPDPNPGFPAQQTSPGAQATGLPTSSPATTSTTPTLNVNATQDPSNSPALQYQFFVSTNPNPTVSSTWWTPWMTAPSGAAPTGISATLPTGKLAPGTRYYWDAVVMDQYSIQGWTSIFSFTTTTLPTYGSAAAFSPSDNSIVATTTPTLTAPAATSTNGKPLNFEIRLTSGTDGVSGQIAQSPLCATSNSACVINGDGSVSWKVPASIMQDGGSYTWVEVINDNYGDYVYTANSTTGVNRLTVNTRVSDPGPAPTDSAGPVTVNLANGNASASFSSPTVHSVGGDMGMNFSYNSQLASNQGLTGTYWNLPTSTTTFGYSPMTAGATQALVRTDSSVNFTWGTAAPDDAVALSYFQAQWTGYMAPPSGTYEFGFQADDGVELQLGTTPIITDQWKNQHQTSPQMEAGPGQVLTVNGSTWSVGSQSGSLPIPITVNYYERMGVANVYLEAAAQSGSSWGTPQVVPANWFSKSPLLLPSGWASSAAIMGDAGEYVSASKQGGSVVVTDTDGGTHTFARTSSGGYTPPPGEQSVLSTDQSGNLVLTDESGTVYQFNSAGLVTSATPAVDVGSKPATPIPNYNSSRQLTSLSDPLSASGSTYTRQVQFSYLSNSTITTSTMSGSNYAAGSCAPSSGSTYATSVTTTSGGTQSDAGMLCQILYPGGTTTQLYYDANGQLARIVDPGNEVTDFSYTTGSHGQYLLSSIRNSLANDWLAANTTRNAAGPVTTDITYTADDKVATVTLPAPDGVTQSDRPQKTYTYTAADSNGNGTTYVDVAGPFRFRRAAAPTAMRPP